MRSVIQLRAIARHLQANGYTTARLGREIGISQAAASRLCGGKTAGLNADSALRLIEIGGGRVIWPDAATDAQSAQAAT